MLNPFSNRTKFVNTHTPILDVCFSYIKTRSVESITKEWLKENNINYTKIVFDIKNKGEYCKNNSIDIMIDDDPNNIRNLINNTYVIIFDYPYNRNEEFNDLVRAYSWNDIYYKINNIKDKKYDIDEFKLDKNLIELFVNTNKPFKSKR